jgi:sterol desaturase/sphingolipid hydroxylase (fatty acid hydroxylase superfamily)
MMEFLTAVGNGIREYGWNILTASTVLFGLELVYGHNRYSLASRLRGALFWALYIVITVLCFTVFRALWAKLGVQPLFSVSLKDYSGAELTLVHAVLWIVGPITGIIIGEFFYYWFHRLQHSSKFMWAFHAEHHAIREMSGWNSNHHFTEEIFRIPFVIIPMSLLIHFDPGYVPLVVWTLLAAHGQYVHSHTRLNFGPLRGIVADNRFHRIHHSIEQRHFDKNFGSFTGVWDMVFGTAYFPKKNEWPDTGLAEFDEPKTVRDFLFRPLRMLRRGSA